MDGLKTSRKVVKFLSLCVCLTQSFLCCSSIIYEDVKFGNVSCNHSGLYLDISVKKNFQGIIYSYGNFFKPNCSYTSLAPDIKNLSLFFPLTDCGTVVRKLQGNVYISNLVVIQKHRFVETTFDKVHNVSCKLLYPQRQKTEAWTRGNYSSRFKSNALESWMDFQLGSDILGKDVSNDLMLGEEFLMVIHLKDGGINNDLKVESCWAYDGETMKESQYTLLVYDAYKCESSGWVSNFNLTNEITDVSDSMTYAVIKAFKFPMTNNVHITCSVQVCKKRCWDYCKVPESQRSNKYPRISKRSTLEGFSDKSLREKYKLMRATVKALGAKLTEIETNRAHRSDKNSGFHRRISNSGITTPSNYEVVIDAEEYDYYSNEYNVVTRNSQSTESSNNYSADSEFYENYMYAFNLTNKIVVFKSHDFNFRHGYVPPVELSVNCISRLRFGMSLATLGFLSSFLLVICVGLSLYLRKERKKHKINNYLLYNFF